MHYDDKLIERINAEAERKARARSRTRARTHRRRHRAIADGLFVVALACVYVGLFTGASDWWVAGAMSVGGVYFWWTREAS